MKPVLLLAVLAGLAAALVVSCTKKPDMTPDPVGPSEAVVPLHLDERPEAFDFLTRMQGVWIGTNKVLSWEWPWFAFDYRPIAPGHVFGIFEGGSMGNLLTSFFVAIYKGKKVLMARNGGVLSGIYRTSYFLLDSMEQRNDGTWYRFVDAVGGAKVMYMELLFSADSLYWNAYTSRLGEHAMPSRHMTFKGQRYDAQLAQNAATQVGFPAPVPFWEFPEGLPEEWMYVLPDADKPRSASYLAQANDNDVFALAQASGDPITISDHAFLGLLDATFERNAQIAEDNLMAWLSTEPLTDSDGYMLDETAFNSVVLFPEISAPEDRFLYTYLHPGNYYLTVIADHNKDGLPGPGDLTHPSVPVTIEPGQTTAITISDITVQN